MMEKLQYINHLNEILDFGKSKLFVGENDLRNYAWNLTTKNNKISGFRKGIATKTLPIYISVKDEKEGLQIRNKVFEIFEKDVLAVNYGKIIIGDYYLECFITESSKKDYMVSPNLMKMHATIKTDRPYWIKETTTSLNSSYQRLTSVNLDYNRDYPYDYTSNILSTALNNINFVPSNFRMKIYGACENPEITIAGHKYAVKASIDNNEYLTIDSINKTIIKTLSDGKKINCFNLRDKNSYIFEKIPTGTSYVSTNVAFRFDVTLLDERSEPKWN